MWINIDKPTKTIKIHKNDCINVPKQGSEFKKLNQMGRDGGWLKFEDMNTIILYCESYYPTYQLKYCNNCCNKVSLSI